MIVVSTGTGTTVKELEYAVAKTTKFLGPKQVVIETACACKGKRPGPSVQYGRRQPRVTEVRFSDCHRGDRHPAGKSFAWTRRKA